MNPTPSVRLEDHEVRLFPSAHISSDREAELRATASLLAIIRAVSEFGRAFVRAAGGPAGRLSCYTEVPFRLTATGNASPEIVRPDGVIHAVRGKTHWVAFLEVKVGKAQLDPEQVDRYHRLARQEGADAVITVSNQPADPDNRPPVSLDGRRLRSVRVVHFSWERLLSEAHFLSKKKRISDPDQKWILDEWIRFVDDPRSRIIEPPELGTHWATVLRAAKTGALGQVAKELEDVASHWRDYLKKAALRLRAKLGVDVRVQLGRKERQDSRWHLQKLVSEALGSSALSGTLRIPDAVGDVRLDLFLHSRCVRYGVDIAAPNRGRQATRVRWLARQLQGLDLPAGLLVDVRWAGRIPVTTVPGSIFIEQPESVLSDRSGAPIAKDVVPKAFTLHWTTKLRSSRGRSSSSVLEGVSEGLEDFYRRVVEKLVPFVPRAPRLERKTDDSESSALSAQDSATEPFPIAEDPSGGGTEEPRLLPPTAG